MVLDIRLGFDPYSLSIPDGEEVSPVRQKACPQSMPMLCQAAARAISLWARKVKSHATRAEMDRGLSSPQLKHGNDRADHFAGEGAKIYPVDHRVMNLAHMEDSRT